jgi:hypothetical protein
MGRFLTSNNINGKVAAERLIANRILIKRMLYCTYFEINAIAAIKAIIGITEIRIS